MTSRRFFESLGLWEALAAVAAPIRRIHVSNQGRFGMARLAAEEAGVDALGYVVANRDLGRVLWQAMQEADIDLWCPARVTGFAGEDHGMGVEVTGEGMPARRIRAQLLVAADGQRSLIRERCGIDTAEQAYRQSALIANVSTDDPAAETAYERFTDSGPLALLPLTGARRSLVWTTDAAQAMHLRDLPEERFLEALQRHFGFRAGRFVRVGRRHVYPLTLTYARQIIAGRVVLVGNAAHTLHPVAGQGFNLAVRDIAELVDLALAASSRGGDCGAAPVLNDFQRARLPDHRRLISATDWLVRLFCHPAPLVRWGRNAGMVVLDLLPPCKRAFAYRAMGYWGKTPVLCSGRTLASLTRRYGEVPAGQEFNLENVV